MVTGSVNPMKDDSLVCTNNHVYSYMSLCIISTDELLHHDKKAILGKINVTRDLTASAKLEHKLMF